MINKSIFICIAACFIAVSCTLRLNSKIELNGSYTWAKESFTLNSDNVSFVSDGVMTLWVKGWRMKVDYEIFSQEGMKWRFDIRGPFNMQLATVIINGENTAIFHDSIWESAPWPIVAENLFGMNVPPRLMSLMLGGRFDFLGECTALYAVQGEKKLCRQDDFYYLFEDGKAVEIKNPTIDIILYEGKWNGKSEKQTFSISNSKTEKNLSIDQSIFIPNTGEAKDEFDDI